MPKKFYREAIPKIFNIPVYGTPEFSSFDLNKSQETLIDELHSRNIVLKARKHGISTLILAISIINCNEFPNYHAGFLANSDNNTIGVFNKAVSLLEHANYKFDVSITKRGVFFENGSWIKAATAGAKAAFRGDDLHMLHLSENAFFEHPEVYSATLEAGQHLLCFIESTANGRNFLYDLWERAKGFPKGCDFKPFFFPWFWHPDNIRELPNGFELTAVERTLKEQYKLSNEQIAWWRWKPTAMPDPEMFPQEFPADDQEAFLSSGRPVFNQKSLLRQKNMDANYRLGGLELGKDYELVFYDSDKNIKGELWQYEEPLPGHQYIIGGDAAYGVRGGNNNTLFVLDAYTREQVAEYCARSDPDQFAYKANQLGRYYNTALMVIERNGPGHTVNSQLYNKYNYPRLYDEEVEDDALVMENTSKVGFSTNKTSKFTLIDLGKRAIRRMTVRIKSVLCINELLAYEYDVSGKKANAPNGKYDDRVIAFLIANFVLESLPELKAKYYPEEEKASSYYDFVQKPATRTRYGNRSGTGY